jgi:tetratricopeptide (TPR) repeat protein
MGLGLLMLGHSLWFTTSIRSTTGLEALRQAEIYRAAGKRTAAEHCYQQALRQLSASPYPALRLAELYEEWGRPQAGLNALRQAMARGHLGPAPPADLLPLYLTLLTKAQAWDDVPGWDKVIQTARLYLQTHPTDASSPRDAEILRLLTTALLQRHDCEAAAATAKQWIATQPTDLNAQRTAWSLQREGTPPAPVCDQTPTLCTLDAFDLGIALIQQSQWSLAACVLAQAEPGAETYAWLGESLLHIGHTEKAHHYLAQATSLEPDNPLGWLLLGRYYLYISDAQMAQPALFRAHELAPQNPAPCLAMMEALAAEGRYQETVAWAEAALIRAPEEDADIRKMIARFYLERDLQQGEFPMQAAEAAAHLAPHDAEAQMILGWTYLYRGDIAKALQALEQAIQLKPHLAEAHYLQGLALQRAGHSHEAHEAFTQAADLGFIKE